jgi:hypothetical protein
LTPSIGGAPAHCCPRKDCGLSVERRGGSHPVYGRGRSMPVALGLSCQVCCDGGGRIVEILKREDFEDHWHALMPDCVSDPDLGERDGGPRIGGGPGAGRGDRIAA